jgi:hypothetical protein
MHTHAHVHVQTYTTQIEATVKGVEIGAAVTLTNMMKFMKHQINTRPTHETSGCAAVVNQLR